MVVISLDEQIDFIAALAVRSIDNVEHEILLGA
jgi:hypothetical protein